MGRKPLVVITIPDSSRREVNERLIAISMPLHRGLFPTNTPRFRDSGSSNRGTAGWRWASSGDIRSSAPSIPSLSKAPSQFSASRNFGRGVWPRDPHANCPAPLCNWCTNTTALPEMGYRGAMQVGQFDSSFNLSDQQSTFTERLMTLVSLPSPILIFSGDFGNLSNTRSLCNARTALTGCWA